MKRILAFAPVAALSVFLVGCASTKIETTGSAIREPLCKAGAQALTTVVYWSPQWRPDQKEPPLREAAALRGIEDFLGRTSFLAVAGINRWPAQDPLPSDEGLIRLVAAATPKPERLVFVVVRELGPRLTIGIPVIVEGGTEVLIDVRVLNTQNSESLANTRTFWRNGGAFVIKGVKTLDQDMSAALSATLTPNSLAK
ncbi:hypothetical protein [Methylococcus sp. EFPC2]|uniref:hypothetical protein n=1 Tax=Methylococcus sp. EFPC2 TaxID=2812648 RepID=UPI00196886FF|nr:hypothetical protein [Methylococcus sp. EFPC2]QSA96512.1 hypothetical protein JWZ97_14995 [Methylococcus sp. EFPC2]